LLNCFGKLTTDFANNQEKMQEISPIKQRILLFVDSLKVSKRKFYEKTGISRGTLESKTGITEDIMAKFIATYPNINLYWLIKGDGEMVIDQSNSDTLNNNDMNCNNCPFKEMYHKLKQDSEWYQEKIDTLENELRTLRHQDHSSGKRHSA
jgi:hypothetical protein